jgi:hypothetical protein
MRKSFSIGIAAAAALATAAVAMAAVFTASGVSATTATLTTTTASERVRSCTGGDGKAFSVTDGRYTNTSATAADFTNPANDLDGPLAIHSRLTLDTGSHLGYVEGTVKVKDGDTRLIGRFAGTVDATSSPTKIAGFLTAHSRGNHATVLGTLSGTYAPATGFALSLGSAPSGTLAVLAGPVCKGEKPKPNPPTPRPKRVEVKGTLTINAGGTVTVTGKGPTTTTCTLGSVSTTGFITGDRVEMKCEYNTTTSLWTVTRLEKHS